jgi:hypothetical protein
MSVFAHVCVNVFLCMLPGDDSLVCVNEIEGLNCGE